jgi:CRISPR-associated protein Cas2
MYYIAVYDVNQKRVAKMLKTMRGYMHWVQNSVFEGKLTESQLLSLQKDIAEVMDEEEDSLIIYEMPEQWMDRKIIGVEKGGDSQFI